MILHLFKTDVRRSRVLLCVWLLLVLLQCALIGSSAHPGDRVLQGIYYSISALVPFFQTLVLVVIIPHLIHEQPLVGTTAFWFTRPIERFALLQSKAVFAGLLIALPLLAEIAALGAGGVTPRDIGVAVPEIILIQLSLIVTIATLAVFTSGFGRFAIVGAIFLVVSVIASMTIYWMRILLHPATALIDAANDLPLVKSRSVAEDLLVVLGGGAVIVHQYLTRRTARSIAGAGVVAAGAIAVMGFWPWNFFAPPPLPDLGLSCDVTAIKVALRRTMLQDVSGIRGIGVPQKKLEGDIEVAGLPAGFVATTRKVHPHLTLPDGLPVATADATPSFFVARPDCDALEHALGGIPVVNSGYPSLPMTSLLTVDAGVYQQYADQPLKLSAELDLVAAKYVVVAAMPLVRGARYDHGSEHAVITDVLRQGNGVEVVVEQRNVQLLFSRAGNAVGGVAPYLPASQRETVYLLRNKKRNEAVLTKQNAGFDFGNLFSTGGRRLVQKTLRLPFGSEPYNLAPDLNEAWLADAELVRLQLMPVATFSRQLVVETLRLSSQNNSARSAPVPAAPLPASFANLALPENATKAQVREYVDTILVASQHRSAYRSDDPQVGMLAKVGPKNLDVLLDAEGRINSSPNIYLERAIVQLAQPEHKAQILQALAAHPNLVELVVKYKWKAEAHDTLLAGLKDEQQRSLPRAWIQAVASFEEPASYPELKAYLVRATNRQQTFNAIRRLPGIDLADAVDAAWKKARHGQLWEKLDGCAMAADFGHADALEVLADILKQDEEGADQRRAAVLFRRYTPATGDNAALIAWYEANRDRLVFDPKQKQFLPQQVK